MWPFGSRMDVEERILVWVRGRGWSHGADIADGLGIGSGTLYPALWRLEKCGRLASEWEGNGPLVPGQPRRRMYCITVAGNGAVPLAESRRAVSASTTEGSRG